MFKDIGNNLMKLARTLLIVNLIIFLTGGLIVLIVGLVEENEILDIIGGVCLAIMPFQAIIFCKILYGFGKLVDNSTRLASGSVAPAEPVIESTVRPSEPVPSKPEVTLVEIQKCKKKIPMTVISLVIGVLILALVLLAAFGAATADARYFFRYGALGGILFTALMFLLIVFRKFMYRQGAGIAQVILRFLALFLCIVGFVLCL